MPWTDETGGVHPSMGDEVTPAGLEHIDHCARCKPQTADPATSATPGSEASPPREFRPAHLQRITSARWKAGDTGLFKKTPHGYIMAGTEAAAKLGLEAGVDGWNPFTVVPDERMSP